MTRFYCPFFRGKPTLHCNWSESTNSWKFFNHGFHGSHGWKKISFLSVLSVKSVVEFLWLRLAALCLWVCKGGPSSKNGAFVDRGTRPNVSATFRLRTAHEDGRVAVCQA